MAEKTMPAAEATTYADEMNSYEFAFHVLPTVAEGEVAGVFDQFKALLTTAGAEIFDEETPEHFDLAYDIEKSIEGKYRKFHSAYFGWIRFRAAAEIIETLTEEIESRPEILRFLMLKLTKNEETNPFRFHEAQRANKKDSDVEDSPRKEAKEVAVEEKNAEGPKEEVKEEEKA